MGLQSTLPHKSTHAAGGTDALTPAAIGAATAAQGERADSSIPLTQKGEVNGVATLDAAGKIPATQIPDLAITDFLGAVADEAAMLAKTGGKGDWVTRADDGKVYVITDLPPSQSGSWTALSYPASPVLSVNSKTGAVVLSAADIGAATTAQGAKADTALQPGNSIRSISAAYTLQLSDASNTISASSALAITIPLNASVAFPIGAQVLLVKTTASTVSIAAEAGVTLNAAGAATQIASQYGMAVLLKVGTNSWILGGDII